MKSFFIDTNILLDFLADRKPFSTQAEVILEYSRQQKVELFVSAISFNNLYYIIRKIEGHKMAINLLSGLKEFVKIIALDEAIVENALKSNFSDFEDAIQYLSAKKVKNIQGIITRNNKDFKKSELPVFLPEIALKIIERV